MLRRSFKDELVNSPVESMIRKIHKLINTIPVVINLVTFASINAAVGVRKCQNTGSSSVQPIPRSLWSMTGDDTSSNSLGCTKVIRRVRSILFVVSV